LDGERFLNEANIQEMRKKADFEEVHTDPIQFAENKKLKNKRK